MELSELEQSERKLQGRCTELKGRLAEADGERVRLQGLLRHKDKELADAQAVSGAGAGAGGGAPALGLLPARTVCSGPGERAAGGRAGQPGPGAPAGVRRPAGGLRGGEPAGQGRAGRAAGPPAAGAGAAHTGEAGGARGSAWEVGARPGRGPRGARWRPRLFSNQQPRPLGALRGTWPQDPRLGWSKCCAEGVEAPRGQQ